ncbi:12023_t:CDS:1 [Funneliformis geosporum]|uniref:10255_t:CDS:1 n=1 Tax=Funneliformis geosporum TaxID=1117311 RepID=A0A9W4SGQ3_9GLOM|nr:10255_t:CDS:1 [Funneliformis geosporum]CAI2169760.1 12023_t:CDS:1 [Funneliformis geosporum]
MSLKVLILGAGYGTRLQRDILNDTSQKYSHLLGVPKALLPLGGKDSLIAHWLDILIESNIDIKSSLYIVTNSPSYSSFISWAKTHNIPTTNIVNDGSTLNENRLGAVEDVLFAIKHFSSYLENSNLLIIGGDTLYLKDFNFNKLYEKFITINSTDEACLVTTYQVDDKVVHKFGILELDEGNKVIGFLEKPSPQSTTSRYACPCFYFLHKNSLKLLQKFLIESKNNSNHTIEDRDATGKFLSWVINNKKFEFFAEKVQGRIDVGGLQSYLDAKRYFGDQDI